VYPQKSSMQIVSSRAGRNVRASIFHLAFPPGSWSGYSFIKIHACRLSSTFVHRLEQQRYFPIPGFPPRRQTSCSSACIWFPMENVRRKTFSGVGYHLPGRCIRWSSFSITPFHSVVAPVPREGRRQNTKLCHTYAIPRRLPRCQILLLPTPNYLSIPGSSRRCTKRHSVSSSSPPSRSVFASACGVGK